MLMIKKEKRLNSRFLLTSKNPLSTIVQNELRLFSEALIEKSVKKMTAENIFTINTSKKLTAELKKQAKPIYPLNDVIIWKASVV